MQQEQVQIEYLIAQSDSVSGLCANVRGALDQGFQPLGGVGVAYDAARDAILFVQSMIRVRPVPGSGLLVPARAAS